MKRIRSFDLLVIMIMAVIFLSISTEASAKWWDKWGEPQYGGTFNFRAEGIDIITEPHDPRSGQFANWFELLWCHDMTLDRKVFPFQAAFIPIEHVQGWLAESWEKTDPLTWTVHIHKGIHWQDKAPTFGREFTAHDIQYSYDRILAKGEFQGQKQNPFFASLIPSIDRVVATDKYTIEFQLKESGALVAYQITGPFIAIQMAPREWVELSQEKQKDWHNCTGTGAFICTDFIPGTSITMSKNPDYWGYDERHPKNRLPYLDKIKVLAIPDMATAIAALRSGKIDMIADQRNYPSMTEAESLAKTNPDIMQFEWPAGAGGLFFKWNTKPFTDIKVRKAMQMSINIPEIAQSLYRGSVPGIPTGLSSPIIGEEWVVPYEEWPEKLKAEYSYNPERARELLAEAGYPDGFHTEILASTLDDMELLQILKSYFMDIGIDMEIVSMDMIQARVMSMEGKYSQMLYGGGGGGISSPNQAITDFWSKKLERVGGAGGVVDPNYDSMVDQFFAATDMGEAKAIYRKAQMYLLEQHYSATVCPTIAKQAAQPWVKGWNGEMFRNSWGWAYFARFWINKGIK